MKSPGPEPQSQAGTMQKLKTALWALGMAAVVNAFPLVQWFETDQLYYANAYDEPTRLNYEVSLASEGLFRLSQFLVTGLHEAGFSGGQINILFDSVLVLLLFVLTKKLFEIAGISPEKARLFAVVFLVLPLLVGRSNPLYSALFDRVLYSSLGSWLVMSEAYFPPWMRTPEPQLSWVMMALASLVSLRLRRFWPLYLIVPFLYLFVQIPYLFTVLSLHAIFRVRSRRINVPFRAILLGVYALLCLGLYLAYRLLIKGSIQDSFLVKTHAPLISLTGLLILVVLMVWGRRISEERRRLCWILAGAVWAAANTQLVTGFFTQPGNFEQYFGSQALALVLVCVLDGFQLSRPAKVGLGVFCCLLLIMFSRHVFLINHHPWQRNPLPKEILLELERDSNRVLADSPWLASVLGLIHPRQAITALDPSQTFYSLAYKKIDSYRCLRHRLLSHPDWKKRFGPLIHQIDNGYRYLHSDFILIHLNRPHYPKAVFEFQTPPENCGKSKLVFVPDPPE